MLRLEVDRVVSTPSPPSPHVQLQLERDQPVRGSSAAELRVERLQVERAWSMCGREAGFVPMIVEPA